MKFFLILLMVSIQPLFSQANLAVDKNSVVWENVYISEDNNVADYLSRHPRLKVESYTAGLLKGTGLMLKNNCADAPSDTRYVSFNFEVQATGNKYRITVSNIVFGAKKTTKAETIFMTAGVLRSDAHSKEAIDCLDSFFNRLFARAQTVKNKS